MPIDLPQKASGGPGVTSGAQGDLIQQFNSVKSEHDQYMHIVEKSRTLRRADVDVEAQRNSKDANQKLGPRETIIPVRVISENIERDLPKFLAYIKGSNRLFVFRDPANPLSPLGALEEWVTGLMQYDDPPWEPEFLMLADGALLHGFDVAEVVYDARKPGHVAHNHIGVDRLIYSTKYDDIEQSPVVARAYPMSIIDIEQAVRDGVFEPGAGAKVREYYKDQDRSSVASPHNVYKIYYKRDGLVFYRWYFHEQQSFLSEEKACYNGVSEEIELPNPDPLTVFQQPTIKQWQDVQETSYPFIIQRRRRTEEKRLSQARGHGQDSWYIQEAASVLTSALVNGVDQASVTMWSPSTSDGNEGSAPKQIDATIKANAIWSRPMDAFHAPYPDPMLTSTLQYLEQRNSIATNQPAFAVMNRKDSRKTATEMEMAQNQTSAIDTVQVLNLSIYMRELGRRVWRIIKSEVLRGNLETPLDKALFNVNYVISSAGDIDYMKRMEMIQAMQADWPILSTTPIGPLLLEDYVKYRYPAQAGRYLAAMAQANKDTQLIQSLATVVKELATDENGQLTLEAQQNANELQQLEQMVTARLAQPTSGMAPAAGNAAPTGPA